MKIGESAYKENVAKYFTKAASYWDAVYEDKDRLDKDFPAYAYGKRRSVVVRCLDTYAGQRSLSVLDIGCGPGVFMEEALLRGHEVAGIDLSEEMVRKASERLEKSGRSSFTCRQGDAENLPLEDNTVDVVLSLGVLPYLKDDRKAIEEICRVLKKGGMVIAVMPNILKLGNLFDCYYYVVRVWQFLWYRCLKNNAAPRELDDAGCFGDNKDFAIRRYTRGQVARLFGSHGVIAEENLAVLEYGPLTVWRRKFLPDRVSIALSEFLVNRSSRWPWLKNFSNEWVISFVKSS